MADGVKDGLKAQARNCIDGILKETGDKEMDSPPCTGKRAKRKNAWLLLEPGLEIVDVSHPQGW
jgi:hypothetical protein